MQDVFCFPSSNVAARRPLVPGDCRVMSRQHLSLCMGLQVLVTGTKRKTQFPSSSLVYAETQLWWVREAKLQLFSSGRSEDYLDHPRRRSNTPRCRIYLNFQSQLTCERLISRDRRDIINQLYHQPSTHLICKHYLYQMVIMSFFCCSFLLLFPPFFFWCLSQRLATSLPRHSTPNVDSTRAASRV